MIRFYDISKFVKRGLLAILLSVVTSSALAEFGVAKNYNVFVEGDLKARYSQSGGRMAAGGNADLTGYGVASEVQVSADDVVLLVGGDLVFSNGRVNQGSVLVGGDVSGVGAGVVSGLSGGATLQGLAQLPIDFQVEFSNLRATSLLLASAEANGQVEYQYGGVRLTGDCSGAVQVFNVDAAQLSSSNHVVVNCVPSNATVVLNVSGGSAQGMLNIGLQPLQSWANSLVWNFHQAESVFFSSVEVFGLVLAPNANLITTWGAVSGSVIAKSWEGSYSLKHRPFIGDLSSLLSQAPTDSDGDGINDAEDQCLATPQGEAVNAQGCASSQLDSDNDGVNDASDQCPDTPEGEQANNEGCALSQLDSDNDGANDAVDQCPNTPEGEVANAEGCAPSQLDSDSDGVSDAIDQCPNTSQGEQADVNGCALSQLDSDNDGAKDAVDQCPNTPEGEMANAEGCAPSQLDSDSDGVSDAIDQCPNTSQGEQADANGCALSQLDSDNDSVNDAVDQCPNTPEGEAPNAEGCAPSQLDSDSDGVSDAIDQCPNTPQGEQVDASGCALSQLDSDNDGINDTIDQCPATPADEPVNAEGCARSQLDADSDSVSDAVDQCPNTPQGEQADANGCALSQLDSDIDGVNDAVDQCPATTAGEQIDAQGCSPDQIDSDGDGTPDYLDAFPNDSSETSDLNGDGIGDNADPDRDGDGVANESDVFPNDPTESADQDGDGIGDNADPDRDGDGVPNKDDYFPSDPDASSVPTVRITSPGTLITVGSSPLRIAGTVDDLNAKLIINGVEIPQNNGSFEADVALEEGANNIIVRAIDERNNEGIATITVSLDKTPPYITVQSPEKGGKVFSPSISVSGLVNDIVRGTVSENEALVRVTGPLGTVTASVSNRSYLADNVQLEMGENQITISAQDAVGNQNTDTFTVTYELQQNKVIELVSGNAQTEKIQEVLAQPLIVKLTENGESVADKLVVFRVTEGDGQLQPGTEAEGNGAVVKTNAEGLAQVSYKLGSRAGIGNHKVLARAVGYKGEVEFYQSATYGDGIQVGIIAGNNQRGAVRQPLVQPLVVAVTDRGANLIPNADIRFETTQGSGVFDNGETTFLTRTDIDGRASANFILGAEEGLDIQRVSARLVNSPARSSFTISGFLPGDPAETEISGYVFNNEDEPIPNATIRIDGSSRHAVTDEDGWFVLTGVPVGPVHLLIDGSTTNLEGEWPSLSYNLVTVAGAENPLASPIYLVKLDTENAVFVGLEDKVVIHPDIPGFALSVKAGSVTFPDGTKSGNLSITRVNANKIPMPPPNGMQPQLIVTIQPHGAKFDPPAKLTIPNTDGHSPLAEVEMYSYDHDLEEFVTIGLGTVSKNGTLIESNEGVGVIKAGWHCGSQPGGNGVAHDCGDCAECNSDGVCEVTPDVAQPDSQQDPADCKTLMCDGTSVFADETSELEDEKFDCKMPTCSSRSGGGFFPGDIVFVNDQGDLTEEQAKCNTCSDKKLSPDTQKEGKPVEGAPCLMCEKGEQVADKSQDGMPDCGDGSPEQACYTCMDGKCGNNCDASKERDIARVSIPEDVEKWFSALQQGANKVSQIIPTASASFKVGISGSGVLDQGEGCCESCINQENANGPSGNKVLETKVGFEGTLDAVFEANAGIRFPGIRRSISRDERFIASIDARLGAGIDAKTKLNFDYVTKKGCGEDDCLNLSGDASVNGKISVVGELVGGFQEWNFKDRGNINCTFFNGLGRMHPKNDPCWSLSTGVSGKVEGDVSTGAVVTATYSSCGNGACTASVKGGTASVRASLELKLLFLKFNYTQQFEPVVLWKGGNPVNCSSIF